MKMLRATGIAGLVLAAGALPVTAYALSSAEDPSPSATQQAAQDTPDDPETEAPDTEAPDTEAPDTEASDTEAPDTDPVAPETSGQPNPASAPGRAHAVAMQAWAHCVAEAASGPKAPGHTGPPKLACGDKPVSPGRAKHAASGAPGAPVVPKGSSPAPGRGHGHAHGHGKGH